MTLCYEVDEKYEMVRLAVREFAESEIKPVAGELDEKEAFSVSLTQKMGDMGLFGMVVPESHGGQGLDYIAYIIAMEEMARVDGSQAATLAAGNSLGLWPIYAFGSGAQRRKYLPDLCRGKTLMGFGLTEPNAGSDAGATNTTAVKDGDSWIINGRKTMTTNADTPMTIGSIVQAVTGVRPDGRPDYTCFIVENGTPGFTLNTLKRKLMWRGSNTAELFLNNCRVSSDTVLGKPGDGFKQMLATLDGGRLSIAAMGLGCAQGAFEECLKYTGERVVGGKPIRDHSIAAGILADAITGIEAARAYYLQVAYMLSHPEQFGEMHSTAMISHASAAKNYACSMANDVIGKLMELMGSYGYIRDYHVEKYWRDVKEIQLWLGGHQLGQFDIVRRFYPYKTT